MPLHGHHVQHHVEQVFNHEQFQIHALINHDLKVKHVQHHPVTMDHGLHGQHVQQHVVAVCNNVDVIIAVVKRLMFKNDHVLFQLVHGVHGHNGQNAQSHVAVLVLCVHDSIHVLVKSILIQNSVILIHVHIMVLGLTGHHVLLHVVLEQ